MTMRCAILDDYQNVALTMADWSPVRNDLAIQVFDTPFSDLDQAAAALQGFDIICMMRERTPFRAPMLERLPDLKLLITTGLRNASIDLTTASARGVTVCGTPAAGNPTTGIVFGLILELTRRIGYENARLKSGSPWQTTIGDDLEGKTLGVLGLGKLGSRVAAIGQAFGMTPIAWSPNLTAARCAELGVGYVDKDELFRQADILSIHVQLSDRSRGLITARELGLMKPTAYLINTARGPIVDEAALIAALRDRRIAGAGLDVFNVEPLPLDHPFRQFDNVVITPHLGYVSTQNYRAYFAGIVACIRGYLDGAPVRVIS